MTRKNIYSLLWITVLLIPATFCVATPKIASIEEFLNKQETIRIVTDAADGFGNQAASANIVVRLRQMGYKGKYEFIYPDRAIDKIAILFDLPGTLPDSYFDKNNNVEFIKLSYFLAKLKRKEIPSVTLGMTGVLVGNICEIAGTDESDNITCSNFANMANTNYFIAMSPFISGQIKDWPSRDDTHLYIKDQAEPLVQLNSDNKFIVMPVASLNDAKSYLRNDARGQELVTKKPALMTLIDSIDHTNINVLPVYGYHVQIRNSCNNDTSNNCLFSRMNQMLQIIAGARYAQLTGTDDFHKPLVIPVFYDYARESTFLVQLINGNIWDTISEPDAAKWRMLINTLGLPSNFDIASAEDASAVQKIQQLQNNQILLLSMGALPKIVFDGLYTNTSENTWPQVREGANTFNSLVLTGKPHLRCSDYDGWEIGVSRIENSALQIWLNDFYDANEGFCKNPSNIDALAKKLGKFILDAHDPASSLSAYFSNLKEESIKPENDRIHYALEEVVKQMQ